MNFFIKKTNIGTNVLTLMLFMCTLPMMGQMNAKPLALAPGFEGDFSYGAGEDIAEINSYSGSDAHVIIPEYVMGEFSYWTATVIRLTKDVFKNNTSMESVTIPQGVTEIRDGVFAGCTNLKNIYIKRNPGNLTFPSITSTSLPEGTNLVVHLPIEMQGVAVPEEWAAKVSEFKYEDMYETFTIENSEGYGTFYSVEPWTMPAGVTGYIVTGVENGKPVIKKEYSAGDNVPGDVGLLLKANKGTYNYKRVAGSYIKPESNYLTGRVISHDYALDGGDVYYYVLSYDENNENIGFYWGNSSGGRSFYYDAYEAWLTLPTSQVASTATGFALSDLMQTPPDATIKVGNLTFTLNADGSTYSLTKVSSSGDIVIPETIVSSDGRIWVVTATGDTFINNKNIPSISYPKTITSIGSTYLAQNLKKCFLRGINYENIGDLFGVAGDMIGIWGMLGGLPLTEIYLDVEGTELPTNLAVGLKTALGKYFSQVTVYVPVGYNQTSSAAQEWTDAGFTLVEKDMRPTTLSIASEEGWGTFYSDNYIQMPEGVTGYVVSEATDGVLTMEVLYPAGSIVPAGTALLVKGAKADYTYENIDDESLKASAQRPASNLLRGTYRRKAAVADTEGTENDYRFYKLSYSGGTNLGFYWGGDDGISFVNGEQKAYLMLPRTAAMANVKGFAFRDAVVSGIEHVETVTPADNLSTEIYTIDGRRATQPLASGIYIKGGKKFYVK